MKHFILVILLFMTALAHGGSEGVGGGDICEERIQAVRNDLKTWIQKDGAKALTLPAGVKLSSYKNLMLEQIAKASIRCLGQGDAGYPVMVDGVPKVCRFDRSASTSQLTCDFKKVLAMSESDQYILVHHEFAGLAGLEKPTGARSDYQISNQLTSYLEDRVVKRLVIKEPAAPMDDLMELELVQVQEAAKIKSAFADRIADAPPECDLDGVTIPKSDDFAIWQHVGAVVSRKETLVGRSKDGRYLQFLLVGDPELSYLFSKTTLRVFTVRLNDDGTEITAASISGYKKAVNNLGSLTNPRFMLAPKRSDRFYLGHCNFR